MPGPERSIELPTANALSSGAPGDIETKPRSEGCSLRRVRRVLPARWCCALQISLILIFAVRIGSNEALAQARDLSTQSAGVRKAEWLTFRDRRKRPDGSPMFARAFLGLAQGMVRYVGEPVAFVVAETLAQAKDAGELIDIDYEALPLAS